MKLLGEKHTTTSFSAYVYYRKSIQAQAKSMQDNVGNLEATGTPVRGENSKILTPWVVGRNDSGLRSAKEYT